MAKYLKPTPRSVVLNFTDALSNLEADMDDILASLALAPGRANLERIITQQFATSLAILWEGFVHDILVAYVLKSHKKYFKSLKKRVIQSVSDKFGNDCGKKLVFAFGAPTSVNDIEPLLDPKGWNISAKSGDHLASIANDLLKSSLARKFSLDAEDRSSIALLVNLRNFLAHKSPGSRKALIQVIRSMQNAGKNSDLAVPKISLDRYLVQVTAGGSIRIKVIFSRMKQIARALI